MIIIYHDYKNVIRIESTLTVNYNFKKDKSIAETLNAIASEHPFKILVWCHIDLEQFLNKENISDFMAHSKMMFSFRPNNSNYLPNSIGYVDESPFIAINKDVRFPTWQMSSAVGMISAEVVTTLSAAIPKSSDFDYYLHSIAKTAMPKGLLCYSEPKLLKPNATIKLPISSTSTLFKFVKQHYRTRWTLLLLLNFLLYEKKLPLFSFLISLFHRNINARPISLERIELRESNDITEAETIDVIIPTIGRKKYLYDVLLDLKLQTHLPKKVIIVEQNPLPDSFTELDYIYDESWPFEIKHIFTHQTGACQARNKALEEVTNKWVFFADDDIRFTENVLEKSITQLKNYNAEAVSLSCLRKNDVPLFKNVFHWHSFGSGCSVVKSEKLTHCEFKTGYEFGFGEDSDFGMQLRNKGCDVLFFPIPEILHLKAPIGGFRTKPQLQWNSEKIQPKPSPTVMLYKLLHETEKQLLGYKTILFFKNYKNQRNKNPLTYYSHFKKQWNQSVLWATKLKNT